MLSVRSYLCKRDAANYAVATPVLNQPFCGNDQMMTNAWLGRLLQAGLGVLPLLVLGPGRGSAAPDGIVLAPHRAIYELALATTRGGTGVSSVVGRMAYDLKGSACEGYTQTMRFVTRMTNQSGSVIVTDLRSTTWEDGQGKRFRFDSSQYRDDKATDVTVGEATRGNTGDEVKVDLTKPTKKTLSVSSRVFFPVQHTIALLGAAKAAKTAFRANLYDGSEKGEKAYDTVSAIGRTQAPGANSKLPVVKNAERLDGLKGWPVSIAYFEPGSDKQDAVPVYELSFVMFENGVSRKLYIDYGEFALQGELTGITFHEPSKCETK
jgi:EipB-like